MGILAWFRRWLGFQSREAAPPSQEEQSRDFVETLLSVRTRPAVPATVVLEKVKELQKANAQWPEIWHALNPEGDPEVQQLLVELRGPHMFAPHVGLNLLEEGCRRTLATDPNADRLAALRAALQSGDPFVRPD